MNDTFPTFNLIDKYEVKKEQWSNKILDFKDFTIDNPKFKIGDKIQFIGGYNNDMIFISEILGFSIEGEIYVLWDCYWLPIKDNEERKIKKII